MKGSAVQIRSSALTFALPCGFRGWGVVSSAPKRPQSGGRVAGENTAAGGHHPPALLHYWPDQRMRSGNQSCTPLFARLHCCTTAPPWRLGPARRDHGEFPRPVLSGVDIPARREGGVGVPKSPRKGYGIHAGIGSV